MDDRRSSATGAAQRVLGNRYEVLDKIGSGGMATVWRGVDTVLSRPVAIKILHEHLTDDQSFVDRFRLEARRAARLTHHNIVAIYDTVTEKGCEAIVMELVEGQTLRQRFAASTTLEEAKIRSIGADIAAALVCAHANSVVHRDIKPANILLTKNGAKLADFGIAKAEFDLDLTAIGTMVGTAAYISPEQVHGEAADARSDLYSLGAVLFEAACGTVPFRGETSVATALERTRRGAPSPRDVRPDLSESLVHLIEQLLARDPSYRVQTAAELHTRLCANWTRNEVQHRDVTTTQPIPAARTRRPAQGSTASPRRGSTSSKRPTALPQPPAARRPSTSGPAKGRRVGIGLVILLVMCSVLMIRALLTPHELVRPAIARSSTNGPVLGIEASAFDPEGTGPVGENNHLVQLATDGDPGTAWRTESYASPSFETKSGVGLLIDLKSTQTITELSILSSTPGWSGSVHVSNERPLAAPIEAGMPITDTAPQSTLKIPGTAGRYLLIWITQLGSDGSKNRVEFQEVEVLATTKDQG